MGWVSDSWRPIKVCVIDLEICPEVIGGLSGYSAIWALIREQGRPRGLVKLPLDGEQLDREQLLHAIAELPAALDGTPLRRPESTELPAISVVICTMFERPAMIAACLRSLTSLDYPDYEVIVVDNRPAGSPPVSLDGVRVVHEPRPGLSAARNRGLIEASNGIVAFTDDDVEVDAAWLLALALRLESHPEEACVTGLVLPRELETQAQLAFEQYYGGFGSQTFTPASNRLRLPPGRRSLLRAATVDSIGDDGRRLRDFSLYATGTFGAGANMAFRTGALRELGGFETALGPGTAARNGEELAAFARLAWRGHRLGFEPAALVLHTHRRGHGALERQIENYGVGYTALLTALVAEDPRHLGRMVATVPRGVRALGRDFRRKLGDRQVAAPPQAAHARRGMALRELRGLAAGPALYVQSRRQAGLGRASV